MPTLRWPPGVGETSSVVKALLQEHEDWSLDLQSHVKIQATLMTPVISALGRQTEQGNCPWVKQEAHLVTIRELPDNKSSGV